MTNVDEIAADIEEAVAGRTLLDVFAENAERYPDEPALRWRSGTGWADYSWREYREQVEHATLGLMAIGVKAGDRVGVLVSNRPELAVADFALLHAGAVPVCLFESFTAEQLANVVRTLDLSLVITENPSTEARFSDLDVRTVLIEGGPDDRSWQHLLTLGRTRAALDDGAFETSWRAVQPSDLVSINYTSGTTGSLKGVRHSHHNVLWHAESFGRFLPLEPGTRFLAYLPRAHATERFVTTWLPLTRAGLVTLCPDPGQLPDYLQSVRPQFFGGILQVWEGMFAGVTASLGDAGAAVAVARRHQRATQAGDVLSAAQQAEHAAVQPMLDAIRAGLGLDQCLLAFSGGGALAPHVQEFFTAIGVPLSEGWGQSELVSAATLATPDRIRTGTAGFALPGVSVRADADGELLVRSGSRMLGYTTQIAGAGQVDEDGWARTGDLGTIDADGYVRILGRREEVFRLDDGYPVPVTRVESQLRANPLVDQACVLGEGQPALTALLVVGAPEDGWNQADLERIVQESNSILPERERIARFAIIRDRWLPGQAEELTHTGKLKRALIAGKYVEVIASL
jgi:long-subunit acyl-CoA synthetase (AMP-forming)